VPDGGNPDGGNPDGGNPDGGLPDAGSDRFHRSDYERPDLHGQDLRLGVLDCRVCHGKDLTGADREPSCDTCHTPDDPEAWRTDCVFCHGGVDDLTGAPPKNLDGSLSNAEGAFGPHHVHVTTTLTTSRDCVECHVRASDVLSIGHVFDNTPTVAEVDLGGGRSPRGTYDPASGCASLYCHGDGQGDDGSIAMGAAPMTCASCHPGPSSTSGELGQMTGLHSFHLSLGAGCQDCHQSTTGDGLTIATPSLHINGQRDFQFSALGFAYDQGSQSCTGTCHGYPHAARPWLGSGQGFHPPGFASPDIHSPEMELQRMDCRACHGSDLTGGAGPSCDTCHTVGWRSNCLFCHGAGDTLTGAPPRDLGTLDLSVSLSFRGHTRHVTSGVTVAFDCTECHTKPSNVLDLGHAFDETPAKAEVEFGGLSPEGSYDGAGTCSALYCHGDGQGPNGTIADGAPPRDCGSCHPGLDSGQPAWAAMGGLHSFHLGEGASCADCHAATTNDGRSIAALALHVNGLEDVDFSIPGFTFDAQDRSCAGTCHGHPHVASPWLDGVDQFHPPGYALPEAHGFDMQLQQNDCRNCHAADLTGSLGPSCDTCHTPGWRSDCVFCHGGIENSFGSPPRDLAGVISNISFPGHTAHVAVGIAGGFDCVQCHVKAVDVLSPGHAFDDTKGEAEVDLAGGLSPQGTYVSGSGCQNLYCHGTGQGDNGVVAADADAMSCESCHAGLSSGPGGWSEMGGLHAFHLRSGARCEDCHQSTTSNGTSIAEPDLHVNAIREVAFSAAGFSWNLGQRTCSGTCHDEVHNALPWLDAGQRFHPVGYALADQHSPDMELQRMDCRDCHAADLSGNLGPSCDTCHSTGWRSNCVFCHGADDNLTGAPPRDLGALPMSGSQAFLAHTAHVTEGISQAFDCLQCHVTPSNVLSMEHAFDDTPGKAEVGFASGLSAAGSYSGAGTCSNLYCHGNGRENNGVVVDGSTSMQCTSCHPGLTSSEGAWESMSGEHSKHLKENFTCGNCHLDVTEDGASIRGPLLHVDGVNQIRFTDTRLNYNPNTGRCAGNCHGENHENESW
jgi:predicted CxxxxCH...CXXCH cytochrome family protein